MSRLFINAPPDDGRCQTCLRPESKLPPRPGLPGHPTHQLIKNYRGAEVISVFWECQDCFALCDSEANAVRARAIIQDVAVHLKA